MRPCVMRLGHPSRSRGWLAAVALATALAVAIGGCTRPEGSPGPAPAGSRAAVTRAEQAVQTTRALPVSQSTVDSFADVLRASGVEVVDDVTSPATAPVRVTTWQVENMAAEAANGGGLSGSTLAALAPTRPGVPPVPFLVVAWMVQEDSDGARFAHALYGGQDLGDAFSVRFPDAVLALFLADATASAQQSSADTASFSGTFRAEPAVVRLGVVDAPCSAVSNFIQQAIEAVADALTVKVSGGGFASFLAGIWNTAVHLASAFVSGLIKTLTKPVLQYLVGVFNAVAAVQQVSSVLIAWRAPLIPDPTQNRFGVDTEQVTGTVTMQLQPHVLPVPSAVKDCADSVGVDISASAAGSGVTWTAQGSPRPDLAAPTASDKALDAKESARFSYRTGQEPADSLTEPQELGTLAVNATIRRNDVERVRQLIAQLLLAQVPPSLRSLVESIARPILDAATGKLAELTDVHSRTQVTITYHRVPDPCKKGKVAAGTYSGTLDSGLRNASVTGHVTASVTIVVDPEGRLSGTIHAESVAHSTLGTEHATEELSITGTTAKPVVTLDRRTVDGKDVTFAQRASTPAMRGVCPASLRWDMSVLFGGTRPTTPDGFMLLASRAA